MFIRLLDTFHLFADARHLLLVLLHAAVCYFNLTSVVKSTIVHARCTLFRRTRGGGKHLDPPDLAMPPSFCGEDNHEPSAWLGPRSCAIALRCSGACISAARRVAHLAVLAEKAVERLLLADRELAGLDARVVYTQQRVDVVHRLCAHVRELLDLRCRVFDLWETCG